MAVTYLVMIRERNDRSTNSKNHRWMNFTMSICRYLFALQVRNVHSDHGSLFLLNIKELYKSFFESFIKVDLVTL